MEKERRNTALLRAVVVSAVVAFCFTTRDSLSYRGGKVYGERT